MKIKDKIDSSEVHMTNKPNFKTIKINNNFDDVIKTLKKDPTVEYIEEEVYRTFQYIPNDPYFEKYQYAPQIMRTPKAWDISQSNPNIVIAIIDSGVDMMHPDLVDKVIPGPDYINGGITMTDSDGHGTFCAGIAAAVTNNGIGIAAIAPEAKILAIKVSDDDNLTKASHLAQAIIYAADYGSKVISISLGNYDSTKIEQEAINYAWNKGSIIIAAAGNESSSWKLYPANYKNVISVGSTTIADIKSSFSNYGSWIDLVAPGSYIWSTLPENSLWIHEQSSYYTVEDGTSFSTPNVAGIAALLSAQGLSNAEILEALTTTADKIPGTGTLWNYGRVNALEALNFHKMR